MAYTEITVLVGGAVEQSETFNYDDIFELVKLYGFIADTQKGSGRPSRIDRAVRIAARPRRIGSGRGMHLRSIPDRSQTVLDQSPESGPFDRG